MRMTKKNIENKMLLDFQKNIEIFYTEEENLYMKNIDEMIKTGEIDRLIETNKETEKSIAVKEATKFFKQLPFKRLEFVNKYCSDLSDKIFDDISNKVISETTGRIMFSMLKHFVLAAETDTVEK